MGLKSSSFWLSWFITGTCLSIAATALLVIFGVFCGFEFFWNTPLLYLSLAFHNSDRIIFILFFVFSMSMMMLAFLLSTLLTSQTTAYAISFLFLLAGVVMQIILTNILVVYLIFYPEEMHIWVCLLLLIKFY